MTVATRAPGDAKLPALDGRPRTLNDWVITFHLVLVAIDPYTDQSAWLLETAGRVLNIFRDADCRVAWLVTADADDARRFLGPWAEQFLTLTDEDRSFVKGLGLSELPALVHIRQDLTVLGAAQGWYPEEWEEVTDNIGRVLAWSQPVLPATGDPTPFAGSPATG